MQNKTSSLIGNLISQHKKDNILDRKPHITFIILAFLISWPLFFVPLAFKNAAVQTRQIVTTAAFTLAMWGPGIAAIVVTLRSGGSFRDLNLRGWGRNAFIFGPGYSSRS